MAAQKIALVTGAGSGVGRSAALALSQEGYAVVLAGRRADSLKRRRKRPAEQRWSSQQTFASQRTILALFAKTKETFGRLDLLFNNAGVSMRGMPSSRTYRLSAGNRWWPQRSRRRSSAPRSDQDHENAGAARRPHYQQRLNLGAYAAASTHLRRHQTRDHRLTKQTSLDCRAYNICCGQIDIGNAATPLTEKMAEGMLQADGSTKPEARMNVDDVGRAVVYMASLPLDANVLFMTVMANKMPFVGRG